MRRADSHVREALDDLMSALGASDPRVVEFCRTSDDEGVSRFAESILRDDALDAPTVTTALWLVPLVPTSDLIANAVQVIRRRPDVASVAGIELGKLRDPGLFMTMEEILSDSTLLPECRVGAIKYFAVLEDPRVTPLLVRVLRSAHEPAIASRLAIALAHVQLRSGAASAIDDLRVLLKSEFPEVRFAAITALGNMCAVDAMPDIEALRSDDAVGRTGISVGHEAQRVSEFLRKNGGRT